MPQLTNKFLGTVSDTNNPNRITLMASPEKYPIYKYGIVAVLGKEFNTASLDMIKSYMDKLYFKVKKGNGEDKLKAFLNSGYKEQFKNNSWIKNNIGKYSRIEFYWNATASSNGTNFFYCTPNAFSKLIGLN